MKFRWMLRACVLFTCISDPTVDTTADVSEGPTDTPHTDGDPWLSSPDVAVARVVE
jgi:hypothetical protein